MKRGTLTGCPFLFRLQQQKMIGLGRIKTIFNSQVIDIKPDAVALRAQQNILHQIENDYVFVFAGGELPAEMLKRAGVQLRTSDVEVLAA